MARTTRMRELVVKILEEKEEAHTRAIFDELNARMKWGATMNQLGNVLAKDPRFQKVKRMERIGNMNGNYSVCVWKLKNESEV